jgi:hypothetical protein
MRRHPQLNQRQPQATSLAGTQDFNSERVKEFFDLLEGFVENNNLDTARISNLEETGVEEGQDQNIFRFKWVEWSKYNSRLLCQSCWLLCTSDVGIQTGKRMWRLQRLGLKRFFLFAFNPESSYIKETVPKVADTFC